MAASKNPTKLLARMLDAVQSPVYLLDSARAIVACNAACLEWTGLATEDLLGQTRNFHKRQLVVGRRERGRRPVSAARGFSRAGG